MYFFITFPMTQAVFAKNESEISLFFTMIVLQENLNKNVLAGAHKKSECVQHTEIYLLGLKVQYKHKTKLPLDMVSKHVLLSVQRPDYFTIFEKTLPF